jgi:hypothetical protein
MGMRPISEHKMNKYDTVFWQTNIEHGRRQNNVGVDSLEAWQEIAEFAQTL